MALLAIRDLIGGYGDSQVLNGVSLAVSEGELVSIVGPNGAGKSTLLKAIVGLARVRGGEIEFDGERITHGRTEQIIRRGIGYVPQVANVFPSLSVKENLALMFPARTKGAVLAERIAAVLEMLPGLEPRLKSRASTLSGGERQMLALARALVMRPRLLLLDEPTAAVAPMLVETIFARVREINDQSGIAILLVEQNAKKALAASHRGYVLEAGRDALAGDAADLLLNPDVERLYLGGSTRPQEEVVQDAGPTAAAHLAPGDGQRTTIRN